MSTTCVQGHGRSRAGGRRIVETYHTLHAEGHVSFRDERALVALVERRPANTCEKTLVPFLGMSERLSKAKRKIKHDVPSAAGVELGLGRVQGVAATLADEVTLERGLIKFLGPLGIALLDARNHHDLRGSTERAGADAGRDGDALGGEGLTSGDTSRDYEGAGDRSSHLTERATVTMRRRVVDVAYSIAIGSTTARTGKRGSEKKFNQKANILQEKTLTRSGKPRGKKDNREDSRHEEREQCHANIRLL